MGILTFGEQAPGLNRHLRNALKAELSKIGFPMLCAIDASETEPVATSTLRRATPLPVILRDRASYGYSGFGALMATAFAPEAVIMPGGFGGPATWGALIG